MNYETDLEAHSCMQCFNTPKLDQEKQIARDNIYLCLFVLFYISP